MGRESTSPVEGQTQKVQVGKEEPLTLLRDKSRRSRLEGRAPHLVKGQIQEVQVEKEEHLTLLRDKSRRSRMGRKSNSPC